MSLDIVFFDVRIGTGPAKDVYKTFSVAVICSTDDNGMPVRFQVTLSEKSDRVL
jgi:hypothetical protein